MPSTMEFQVNLASPNPSQNQVNSIMGYLADDCDFYNFSHVECVRWIEAGIYGPLYPRIKLDNMVLGLIGSGP